MNEYAFDCTLACAIRVQAPSEEAARALLRETINAAEANLGAWPNGDPILCEVSLIDEEEFTTALGRPALYEVNGEEP